MNILTPPGLVRQAAAGLAKLAKAINRGHAAVLSCAGKSLEHARATGELLIRAKETLPHGEYLPWLAEHCEVSERHASRYMLIAHHWQEKSDTRGRFDELSLRGFLDLLAGDDPAPPEAWETPSAEPVAETTEHIDTLLEQLPPAQQVEVLERNAKRLEASERADTAREGRDGQKSLPGRIEQACKKPERLLGQWDGDRDLCLGLLHALLQVVKGEGLTVKQASALEVFRERLAA